MNIKKNTLFISTLFTVTLSTACSLSGGIPLPEDGDEEETDTTDEGETDTGEEETETTDETETGEPGPVCGNGIIEPLNGEDCDGDGIIYQTSCRDLGYLGTHYVGEGVRCTDDCKLDTSECVKSPLCGDGVIDQGVWLSDDLERCEGTPEEIEACAYYLVNEVCDGENLGGKTCEDQGFCGGTLKCDPVTCSKWDTTSCEVDENTCGGLFDACNVFSDGCCDGLTCVAGFGCLPE